MDATSEAVRRADERLGMWIRGKWELVRVLGIGGMATVYEARHRNRSRVAVKMLHQHYSLDPQVRERFLREGYVANTLAHPSAVLVLDDDVTDDGEAFLVMELLHGETLEQRLERSGPLPIEQVLAIAVQLLDVLARAHSHGIIHRDIKPENLFVTCEGQLKVLDFGIARVLEPTAPGAHATAVGTFLGTPAYMPPEQARGYWHELDDRSDLWAVGATLFSLLTGRTVHQGDTLNDQLIQAATAVPPPLVSLRSDAPEAVCNLVDRALAQRKEDRWPNAREMAAAAAVASVHPPRIAAAPLPVTVDPTTAATIVDAGGVVAQSVARESEDAVSATRAAAAPQTRTTWWVLGGSLSLAVAVIVGVSLLRSGRATPALAPDPSARPVPTASASEAQLAPKEPSALPSVTPSLVPDRGLVAPSAPSRPNVRVVPPRRGTSSAPAPTASSPPATTTAPNSNPFDRRF